jgi:surfactin synthase thioesterase subunit
MNSISSNPWFAPLETHSTALLRLFCFPHAGGGAATYRKWSAALPSSVEVCPVLLPGREARLREPAFSSVFPLIEALAPAIIPFLKLPFVFFGHSMGALVAFELVRELRRRRERLPECLFVSAREAPGFTLTQPPISDLPEEEFARALVELKGAGPEVLQHPELMKLMSPTLRADFALHERYEYVDEPALACSIVAFGGLQDTNTDADGLSLWRGQTSGSFVRRMFPGDHSFINTHSALFLNKFSQELQRIIAGLPGQPRSEWACTA